MATFPGPVRSGRWKRRAFVGLLLTGVVSVIVLVYGTAPLRTAATAFHGVRWELVPALVLLSVVHYVLAAVALRGAAGHRLPMVETTLAQFTAAAANRVTPGGLGAAAVNTRYLVCRGMPPGRAVVAVAALQIAGVPADLLMLGAVLALSGGGNRMADALGSHATTVVGLLPSWPLLAAAGVLVPVAALWWRRAVRSAPVGRVLAGVTDLCRRPGDLALTLAASAGTTFVLGLAFGISVLAVPGAADTGDMTALLAAYLIGAAAGTALPSPGGMGSTEAALVAALAALGVAAAPAVQAVLLFRLITYWAPVPVGLMAFRTLRVSRGSVLPGSPGTPG
ncbi:membrane protein [Actinomadura rubrobrunea]|uniref:Membrane protein n=1 Tax=Actinomadura rubrobrunea TaxID=115335 RepID=A0A9W6PV10_9ACTN|nr:membrane protein [Actinomadura rubrobrunea]